MKIGTWAVSGRVERKIIFLELVLTKQKDRLHAVPEKTVKKKIRRTKLVGKREPGNYDFWKGMLKDNLVQQFIERGDIQQKTTIKKVLMFLKLDDCDMFEEVNGKDLLKQLKGKIKCKKILKT